LENRRGKNDEMSRGVWITVETKAGKIRVVKAKRGREKKKKKKGTRREEAEKEGKEKTKKG